MICSGTNPPPQRLTEIVMNIRNALTAVSASALLVAATPAVANAQIVAPAPSSNVAIPVYVTDFVSGFSPVSREETEQALKILAGTAIYGGKGLTAASSVYQLVTSSNPVGAASSLIRRAV